MTSPYGRDDVPVKRRKRPTNATKLDILEQLRAYHRKNGEDFPRSFFIAHIGFSKQCISDWLHSPRLAQVAYLPESACKKRLRNVVLADRAHFRAETDIVFERFLFRRQVSGLETDYEWIRHTMKGLLHERKPKGYQDFKYSNGWLQNFLEFYDISHQVQTEKKPVNNADLLPLIQTFHRELCTIQQSKGLNPRDPVYGRFPPKCMYNTDQVPASLINSKRSSLNVKGEACWVLNQGASGLSKRSMTIILTLRAEGEQIIPPFLLLRGEGCVPDEVLEELNEQGIPYAFNTKAWANAASCLEYLTFFKKILTEKCPEEKEHMLLLDGLGSQATSRFIELALDMHILPVYFPPGTTHLLQPVDHRVAAWVKRSWHRLYLVEEQAMYDKWAHYRDNGSMSAQYLRVTSLRFMRFIWNHLKLMKNFLKLAFTSTGCLITLKGEHAIKFRDIQNYSFDYPTHAS